MEHALRLRPNDFARAPDPDARDSAGITNVAAQGRSAIADSELVVVDTP
jgi:hypothetical protein